MIESITERKGIGIDCTEAESAEIKGLMRELIEAKSFQELNVLKSLFPLEASEIE